MFLKSLNKESANKLEEVIRKLTRAELLFRISFFEVICKSIEQLKVLIDHLN
jgi:hypothetical protein